MKLEQLPSGSYRIRIMIDGHRYTFTDKDKLRVKAKAAQFADQHREAIDNPTLLQAMDKYIDEHDQFQLKDIPKTTESSRRIKLPHFVVKKIREQGYVTKYNPDQISHYFRRMQQRVGLEDVYRFHSTRHYCVSSLHANGLPDAYIMERGGWSTPDVLIYVYRHTISDETAALTDKALNHFDSVTKFVTN